MADETKIKWEAVVKQVGTTFAALGGSVVVFYALGFMIVQCFITSADVEGMFWFSREYYEEAGGKFIVDIARTPLMKPAFFVLYLAVLLSLVPGRDIIKEFHVSDKTWKQRLAGLPAGDTIRALLLLVVALGTYFFMAYFERLAGSAFFAERVMPVFFWSGTTPNEQKQALLFFSLTVPMVAALGLFLHRLFKYGGRKSVARTALALYIIFVSILPISYGRYVFDIKAVPINDPQRMYALSGINSDLSDSSKMWFLGRFGGKYLFLRKDNLFTNTNMDVSKIALVRTQGVVESLNESDVKNMNFTLERADTLRNLMKPSRRSEFAQEARKVFDDMFK